MRHGYFEISHASRGRSLDTKWARPSSRRLLGQKGRQCEKLCNRLEGRPRRKTSEVGYRCGWMWRLDLDPGHMLNQRANQEWVCAARPPVSIYPDCFLSITSRRPQFIIDSHIRVRRSVCAWVSHPWLTGARVHKPSSLFCGYFCGNSMEFRNGHSQKKRGTTVPSAHSKLYNIQTCPTADLEPDSNSSVMLFLVEHTHTQNLSPGFLKWPPDQDQDPIPIPIPSLIFQSKTQPKSLQTAGRHDCGRHALDLISLFAHVTSPPTDRTQTKTLTMSGHREQWFGAW